MKKPTDKERLDWLQKHKPKISWDQYGCELVYLSAPKVECRLGRKTLRETVDLGIQTERGNTYAAIRAEKGGC